MVRDVLVNDFKQKADKAMIRAIAKKVAKAIPSKQSVSPESTERRNA